MTHHHIYPHNYIDSGYYRVLNMQKEVVNLLVVVIIATKMSMRNNIPDRGLCPS